MRDFETIIRLCSQTCDKTFPSLPHKVSQFHVKEVDEFTQSEALEIMGTWGGRSAWRPIAIGSLAAS